MLKRILAALMLAGVCVCVNVQDYNEIVRFVFGDPPSVNEETRVKKATDIIEWENSMCECVPYYQCNYNGSMNENGLGIIDIRLGLVGTVDNPQSQRRHCEHFLSVCCLAPELLPGHDEHGKENPGQGGGGQSAQGSGGQSGQGTGGQGGQGIGDQGGIIGEKHVNKGCGYRNSNGIGFRITGNSNNEANFAEFPWMVAVLKQTTVQGNSAKVYQCGGSLIHRRVVLTAAHCVYGQTAKELTIRAGEWDTQTVNEPLPHQDREVTVVTTHPEYKRDILHNDYALLILAQPVDLAENIEVVCLPEANEVFDNSKCFATGWGKNNFGDKGHYQVILKAIELPTVPHAQCQNALRTTRLGKYFKLHETFMCAGGVSGLDTCTGDGGSPLVCPLPQDPTRYIQAGIVAWGIGCGENNVPGVYADVTKGRHWIDQVLSSYSIDNLSYTSGANADYR